MKLTASLIIASILVFPAMAHAEFKGCYERVYDKAYLRKNKKQQITKMRFQFGVGEAGESPIELLDRLDAVFRDTSRYKGKLVTCQPSGDELSCTVASNGGQFTVTDRGDNSIRITNESFLHFDEGNKLKVKAKAEHKLFRLDRISKDACP